MPLRCTVKISDANLPFGCVTNYSATVYVDADRSADLSCICTLRA
jgi:hypothetical protein